MDDFGHAAQFPRVLRRFALFAVAFSIVSITTGIFLNYSYGLTQMGPAAVWLWPVATVGQLLVVLVLAELAGHVPLAGANYQWAARLVDARFGYVVGALGVLYGAVGLPGIALLGLAPLTATVLGLDAADGRLLVFLAVLALVVAYLINIVRVQLAARVNNVAVFAEIIGTVLLSVVVFVAWVRGGTSDGHGLGFLFTVSADEPLTSALVGGALIGVFTLVGFEAAADMAEEAVDARRAVPRMMILSLVVSGVLGMVALVGFTAAIPDLAQVSGLAGAARRDRRVLAGPGAHAGVPRRRRVLDVRADRRRGRGELAADLRDGPRRHAPVLRLAAEDPPAHRRRRCPRWSARSWCACCC